MANSSGWTIAGLKHFHHLEHLDVSNTAISVIPDLDSSNRLVSLNLRKTKIKNLDNLPSYLKTLVLPKGAGNCSEIPPDTFVEEVVLSGEGLDLSACSNIQGLKTIRVENGTFSNEVQDISGFAGSGLCQLSINNTNISRLISSTDVPIQRLSFSGNKSLSNIKSSIHRYNFGDLWKRPHEILIDDTSSQLACGRKDKIEDWDYMIVQGQDIPVGCPELQMPVVTRTPSQCKPNAPFVKVYQDIVTARQFVTWQVPVSHDYPRWGVTKMEVSYSQIWCTA